MATLWRWLAAGKDGSVLATLDAQDGRLVLSLSDLDAVELQVALTPAAAAALLRALRTSRSQ